MSYYNTLEIPIELIDSNPYQTRAGLDDQHVADLAEDIRKNGLLQVPVGRIVDADGNDPGVMTVILLPDVEAKLKSIGWRVQIAFGHNRLAAYRKLDHEIDQAKNWRTMPVDIRVLTDQEMALLAWSENARRKDLTAVEEAQGIKRMMDTFGWTQVEAAEKVGLARETIAGKLRLLKLPDELQEAVKQGKVSERAAVAFAPLVDLPKETMEKAEQGGYFGRPSVVLKSLIDGDLTSDKVRVMVDDVLRRSMADLRGCGWINFNFGEGYVSERCDNCLERVKLGKEFHCRRLDCHAKKSQAWKERKAADAIAATGLELAPSNLKWDEQTQLQNKELVDEIRKGGCPKRLLMLCESPFGVTFTDAPGYGAVCVHGEGHKCTCKSAIMKKIEAAKEAARVEKRKELDAKVWQPAVAAVEATLIGANTAGFEAVMFELLNQIDYVGRDERKKKKNLNVVRLMAEYLIERLWNWDSTDDMYGARARTEEWLKKHEIPVPWGEQA